MSWIESLNHSTLLDRIMFFIVISANAFVFIFAMLNKKGRLQNAKR